MGIVEPFDAFSAFRISDELSTNAPHEPVSLANIATAFLIERKTSTRCRDSVRRQRRLTTRGSQRTSSNYQSTCPTIPEQDVSQRSPEKMTDDEMKAIFAPHTATHAIEDPHRTAMVNELLERVTHIIRISVLAEKERYKQVKHRSRSVRELIESSPRSEPFHLHRQFAVTSTHVASPLLGFHTVLSHQLKLRLLEPRW